MEERPDELPEWVWLEYLEWVAQYQRSPEIKALLGLEQADEEELEVARTIIHSEKCKTVWKALERRAVEFDQHWVESNVGMPDNAQFGHKKKLHALLLIVSTTKNGPLPHDLIPGQERRKRGARIAQLAKELRVELEVCSAPGYGLPSEIDRHVSSLAAQVASAHVELANQFQARYPDESPTNDLSDVEGVLALAIQEAMLGDSDPTKIAKFPALRAIETGAIEWTKTKAVVHRPDDPNMCRLHFVRSITQHFIQCYGSPLFQQTAAITNAVFGCDLDPPTIKKLAG